MSAQSVSALDEVEIRCATCEPDLGARASLLAVAQRDNATPDRWRLLKVVRLSRPDADRLGGTPSQRVSERSSSPSRASTGPTISLGAAASSYLAEADG